MIAAWMLYAIALSAAVSVAALLIERALRLSGRSARHAWALALCASIVAPLLAHAMPDAVGGGSVGAAAGLVEGVTRQAKAASGLRPLFAAVEQLALFGWIVGSLFFVLTIALSRLSIARERRRWSLAEVDGTRVWVSRGIGPAVIGFLRSTIVLPRWAMDAPPRLRTLMLAHEREHLAAGDPLLLLFGLCALIAAPWNPLMWWQLRRLRVAVEIDCDARVLARCGAARDYAELLIEVARRGRAGRLAVAAFSSPATAIERRIRMMVSLPPRRAGLAAVVCVGLAVGVLVLACEMPAPAEPELSAPTVAVVSRAGVPAISEVPIAGEQVVEGMPLRASTEKAECTTCAPEEVELRVVEGRRRRAVESAGQLQMLRRGAMPARGEDVPIDASIRERRAQMEREAVAGKLEEVVVTGRLSKRVPDETGLIDKVRIRQRAPDGPTGEGQPKTVLLRRTGG